MAPIMRLTLGINIICITGVLLVFAFVSLPTEPLWSFGYMIVAAMSMVFVIFRGIEQSDILRVRNAIPVAFFLFILPSMSILAFSFVGQYSYTFQIILRTLSLDQESINSAFLLIAAGSIAYSVGTEVLLPLRGVRREPQIRSIQIRTVRTLAIAAFTVYWLLQLFLHGITGAYALVTDPVMREQLRSTSLTGIFIELFLIFILSMGVILYQKRQKKHAAAWAILMGILGMLFALPFGSRGYVFAVAIPLVFIWHYGRSKLTLKQILICLIILPVLATSLRFLRTGAETKEIGILFSEFVRESNMVQMLALSTAAVKNGALDYQYGRDIYLVAALFVPRAMWPEKPLPLDFRLTGILGLDDDGKLFGSPITIFGGLWLNLTAVGMVISMFCIGLIAAQCDRRWTRESLIDIYKRAILFYFLLDLTRVGDISRELSLLIMFSFACYVVLGLASFQAKTLITVPDRKSS